MFPDREPHDAPRGPGGGFPWGVRVNAAMGAMPNPVGPEQLAASITFLLPDDGVNLNGVILPSDGGWSAV